MEKQAILFKLERELTQKEFDTIADNLEDLGAAEIETDYLKEEETE